MAEEIEEEVVVRVSEFWRLRHSLGLKREGLEGGLFGPLTMEQPSPKKAAGEPKGPPQSAMVVAAASLRQVRCQRPC